MAETTRPRSSGHLRLDDVASRAGVSRITVSRALRDPSKVAPKTRAAIQDAIKQLAYVPNLFARGLASNRSRIIAVIVPTITNSLFAETIQGLAAVLRPAGYELLVGETSYSAEIEEALIAVFLQYRPEAIVLTQLQHSAGAREVLQQARLPVVETWDLAPDPLDLLVGFSNFDAAAGMTRHLIARGYRRIRFVLRADHGPGDRTRPRYDGFRAAMMEAGLEPGAPLAVDDPLSILRSGRSIADQVTAQPEIDALFCTNELIAVGAILECQRRGISVPGRIAIAGFGDVELASAIDPGLTTIRIPGRTMGERAAEMILGRIAGQPAAEPVVDVGYQLVIRGSTGWTGP